MTNNKTPKESYLSRFFVVFAKDDDHEEKSRVKKKITSRFFLFEHLNLNFIYCIEKRRPKNAQRHRRIFGIEIKKED